MGINVGTQQAGVINNVEGDQMVLGGQVGTLTDAQAHEQLRKLRQQLAGLGLAAPVASAIASDMDALEHEFRHPAVDKHNVAGRLHHLTKVLSSVGVLVSAGVGLISPIGALAAWLGALGEPVRRLLAG